MLGGCDICIVEIDYCECQEGLCIVLTAEAAVHSAQEMVLPEGPVLDFRTAITGHTAADMEGLSYTREAARQDLLQHLQSSDHVTS